MRFNSLKENDFKILYSHGNRISSKNFSLVYSAGSGCLPAGRQAWGLSVSGKLGNAVKRNLLRRRIKEFLRGISLELSTGLKAAIVPRIGAVDLSYRDLSLELLSLFRKARIVS